VYWEDIETFSTIY